MDLYKDPKAWNKNQQYPNWVMTLNYGSEGQLDFESAQLGVAAVCEKSDYWIYGKEVASTGQKHFQAYFQLEAKQRLTAIKKWSPFLNTCHLEPARGDEVQNKTYCSKEGDFLESDTEPRKVNPGKREKVRWEETASLAKQGRFMECEPQMQVLHLPAMMRLYNYCKPNPDDLPHTWRAQWYWGPPGTGKSLTARTEIKAAKPGGVYMKLLNKWWDNFREDQGVIMEDVDHETCKHLGNHIKLWLDIYPFSSEVKGTVGTLRPDMIIVTSNYHPFLLFGHDAMLYGAVMRRLNLRYFPRNGEAAPEYPAPTEELKPGCTLVFTPPNTSPNAVEAPATPEPPGRPHFPITRETIDVTNEPDPSEDEADEEGETFEI